MALTGKQAVFAEEYLRCFNKTEAARRAGYTGNNVTLGAIGYENFKKPQIQKYIQLRLSETAMSADEVLARLASHARGDISDFWEISEGGHLSVNLGSKKAQKSLHLIKKLKTKTKSYVQGDDEAATLVTEVDIEFEMYDAQSALAHIGKHHRLFVDRTEVSGKDGAPLVDIDRLIEKIYGKPSGDSGTT